MVAPTSVSQDVASTFGWDTVFGINISDVNAVIAKRKSSPDKFDVTDPKDGVSASGVFGAWAIAMGGDNNLINMTLPIPKVTVSLPGGATDFQTDVSASITVRLNFLHSTKAAKSGSQHELVIWDGAPVGAEVVTVNTINYGGPTPPTFMTTAAFQELLKRF